jgi:hypothetical protein
VASGADEFPPRLYGTDAEVRRIAAGLLSRTLPRAEWTHEAHLAAVCVLILGHPKIFLEQELPGIISGYNVAVGGVNDSSQGYHETLTQFWIANARAFLVGQPDGTLVDRINSFIASPAGRRDAPLRHFSRDRLFSVEARLGLVEPDIMRFPWDISGHAAPAPQL